VINLNAARALGLTIPPGIMPAGTVKELVALIGAKPWQVTSLPYRGDVECSGTHPPESLTIVWNDRMSHFPLSD
jgi:hypothetical protein